jgi:NAD binding domain of 6-phosphogluconate dehydrogenase
MSRIVLQVLLLLEVGVITSSPYGDVTVLGLGGMGTAVAKCLAATRSVHVWNRSRPSNMQDLSATTLHASLAAAVENATTILVVIDNWEGAKEVTRIVDNVFSLNGKNEAHVDIDDVDIDAAFTTKPTVMVFSTYTPDEIQEFEASGAASNVNLVGGAIVGVPATICSKSSVVFLSSSPSSASSSISYSKELVVDPLGTVISIDDIKDTNPSSVNVGSASLLNIALILTITFGLAGSELAHLMLQRAATDRSVMGVYSQLARDVAIPYTAMLLPLVSESFAEESFLATYVPAMTLHALFRKVCHYIHESLGISDETFLDTYVASLGHVHDPQEGPLAWTKPYLTRTVKTDEL